MSRARAGTLILTWVFMTVAVFPVGAALAAVLGEPGAATMLTGFLLGSWTTVLMLGYAVALLMDEGNVVDELPRVTARSSPPGGDDA